MVQRIMPKKNQSEEQARRQFDASFGVSEWHVLSGGTIPVGDPRTPSWWYGDEEAAGSFLAAVGVRLDG